MVHHLPACRSLRLGAHSLVLLTLVLCPAAGGGPPLAGPPPAAGVRYHDQSGREAVLRDLARSNRNVQLHELAVTAGGRRLQLLEIAPGNTAPGPEKGAVLVVADPLGNAPLATEAALALARMLADPDRAGRRSQPSGKGSDNGQNPENSVLLSNRRAAHLTWYIIAAADPDGSARFFQDPAALDGRNGRAIDDDKDGSSDEDGPDDLDGDHRITTMLLAHPEGRWLLTEDSPRLPKQADPVRGERGLYKRFIEGADDDRDGQYNEDGPGGVVPGKNFPHAFEHWTDDAGLWPASEVESRAVLKFAFEHPEIAMVLVFGTANTLAKVPDAGAPPGEADVFHKLPHWMAEESGLSSEQKYKLDDLVAIARDVTGNSGLTPDDVLGLLELGAATCPDQRDLGWWNEISGQYRAFLAAHGLAGPRIDPTASVPGSVEEWAYFQFGVPTFALDFWSVPRPQELAGAPASQNGSAPGEAPGKGRGQAGEGQLDAAGFHGDSSAAAGRPGAQLTPEQIEAMTSAEFIGLGEQKIAAFLEANDAPPSIQAPLVIKALQDSLLTPAKIAEMMRRHAEQENTGGVDPDLKALAAFSNERLAGQGFVPWREVTLPDGRSVLVGGEVPSAYRTPPAVMVDSLLSGQVPFVFDLVDWLPRLDIAGVEVDYRGAAVYDIKVHVGNTGRISYPTAQGKRCRRVPPVALTLEGAEIIEGRPRQVISDVPALGTSSSRWLIRGKPGTKIIINASTPSAGAAERVLVLDGRGGLR